MFILQKSDEHAIKLNTGNDEANYIYDRITGNLVQKAFT